MLTIDHRNVCHLHAHTPTVAHRLTETPVAKNTGAGASGGSREGHGGGRPSPGPEVSPLERPPPLDPPLAGADPAAGVAGQTPSLARRAQCLPTSRDGEGKGGERGGHTYLTCPARQSGNRRQLAYFKASCWAHAGFRKDSLMIKGNR